MTNKISLACTLALLLSPSAGFASKADDDAAAKKAAEEEARRRYEAMIQGLCSAMDGTIGGAEKQRAIIMEVARGMGTEDGRVRGAWDSLVAVTENLEGAHDSNNQAKAMVQPEANLNNAQVLVQDSRKDMLSVAQMLSMNVEQVFGFSPPGNWNGAMPGEKPSSGWNPNGTVPMPGGGGGGGGGGAGGGGYGNFPPMAPPATTPGGPGQIPAGPGGKTPGAIEPGSTANKRSGQDFAAGPRLNAEGGMVPLLKSEGGISARAGSAGAASMGALEGAGKLGASEDGYKLWGKGASKEEVYENPLRPGAGMGSSGGLLGHTSKETAEAWSLNMKGDYAAAETAAREAIRRDPSDHKAYEALAWAELRMGRYKDSERDATRAIELDHGSARAYRIRAFARQMLGDRKGMLADIEKAAQLDPAYEEEAAIARRGGNIYDPSKGDEELLIPHRKGGPLKGLGWLLFLAAGAASGTAFFLHRARRRQSGSMGKAASFTMTAQAPTSSASAEPAVPGVTRALDAYELGEKLSEGRGSVLLAKDKALGRTVVVRRLKLPDPGQRALFLASARKAARFDHPAAVRIYDIAEEGEWVSLACEHVEGKTVRELIARQKVGGLERVVRLMTPVCHVLEASHRVGIVHGRLHLGNIFFSEGKEVKVADFGTADPGAEPAQDIAALGRCLTELLEAEGEPIPDRLKTLIERAEGRAEPPLADAREFRKLLAG